MGQKQCALLSEVRQRSKSFTEEKNPSPEQETSPPGIPPLPSLDAEWSASPATPRDLYHDSPAGVTSSRRQLARQRDVDGSGDVASPRGDSDGVSSVVGHLRQRVVDIDDSERDVTSFGDRDVTADISVNRSSVYSSEHTVRDSVRDVDTVPSCRVDERRVLVNVEHHSRTYSDAWDEYDSGEESNKAENPQNISARETTKCSERSSQGDDDRTWVSSHSKTDEAVSARRSTLPRHRPAPLYSSQSQTNVFISRDNADSVVADPQDKQLARFSSSETLGRQPRGPILRYLQRTREADHSPSTSPRAFSLDSPRERTFVFPEEFSGTSSTDTDQTLTAQSSQPVQSSSSSADVAQTSAHVSQSSVATKPKHHASASSQRSSTGIPQPSRKSSSIPQRSRSASQGPPQGPRKLPSALPVSSAGSSSSTLTASAQNSRAVSSGIPIRPRSSSTGPAYSVRKPLPKRVDGSGIPGAGGRWKKEKGGRAVPPVAVRELAARDLSSPAMHGFLCRKTSSDDWVRYWHVLQEDSLYCYLTPDDHVTVDVTDLDGYSVTSLEDKFPGQRFVLYLEHEDYIPVYLSASTREELEEWYAALTSAIKIIPRINGLHLSQQHEEGESARAGPVGEERVLGIKQKLLAEVLRQTQELEKKQAARLAHKHKQSSQEDYDMHSPPSTPPPPSSHTRTGEQICTLTRLRQRRMSTQIKMDTIQRQMQSGSQQSKKSRFTFGKKKSVEEAQTPQNPDLVRQLKTLSDHLSEIDRDLMQNGGVMAIERKSASLTRGQKLNSRHSQEMESSVVEGGGGGKKGGGGGGGVEALINEDNAIGRNNSLKSSVQKLAHRTFAKAGWHRGKKTYSLDRDDSDEKADDLYHHNNNNNDSPDVIDLSRRLMRTWPARDTSQESEEGGELFLPPPSSFDSGGGTDTPSPVSSPRSPRSAGSVSSERAGSRSSSARRSEMMSRIPRRRVDPDAMANIEAFEEMSREILGEPT